MTESLVDRVARLMREHDYDLVVPDGGGLATWVCAAGDGPEDDDSFEAHLKHVAEVLTTGEFLTPFLALIAAAEVVVLDAGDEATGPEPDPNLAELAYCLTAVRH